jgi:hypothetical protein
MDVMENVALFNVDLEASLRNHGIATLFEFDLR